MQLVVTMKGRRTLALESGTHKGLGSMWAGNDKPGRGSGSKHHGRGRQAWESYMGPAWEGNEAEGANLAGVPGAGSAQSRAGGGVGTWAASLGTSSYRLQFKTLAILASSSQNSLLDIGIGQEAKAKRNWLGLGGAAALRWEALKVEGVFWRFHGSLRSSQVARIGGGGGGFVE